MSVTMKSLAIDQLSISERILLVEEIWDSIVVIPEKVPLTEAQATELDRRLLAYDADPDAGSTWDEMKARLWGRP